MIKLPFLNSTRRQTPAAVHPEAARETDFSRAARNNGILVMALAIQSFVVVSLSIVILALFPTVKIQPVFVGFDEATNKIVTIETARSSKLDRIAYAEAASVDYIRHREGLSSVVDANADRIKAVRLFSSDAVFGPWRRWVTDDEIIQEAVERGYNRRIILQSARHQPIERKVPRVTVDYIMVDTDAATGAELQRQCRTADLIYAFLSAERTPDEFLINPLGFTITGYTSKPRESDDAECRT